MGVNHPAAAAAGRVARFFTIIRLLHPPHSSLLQSAAAELPVCLVVLRLRRGPTLLSLGLLQQWAADMAEVAGFPLVLAEMVVLAAVVVTLQPARLGEPGQADKALPGVQ